MTQIEFKIPDSTPMGVLHSVLPLNSDCTEWLDREGIVYPAPGATSRFPTPREITSVLQQLHNYTFALSADSSSGEWWATITAANSSNQAWASLRITNYSSDDEPHEFYFPKGWPEVIFTIVERLARHCGPLVVVDDSAVSPIVMCPNDPLQDLLQNHKAS